MSENNKEGIKKFSTSMLMIYIMREVCLQIELDQKGGEEKVLEQMALGNSLGNLFGSITGNAPVDIKAWRVQRGATKELAVLACEELDRRIPTPDDNPMVTGDEE